MSVVGNWIFSRFFGSRYIFTIFRRSVNPIHTLLKSYDHSKMPLKYFWIVIWFLHGNKKKITFKVNYKRANEAVNSFFF